MFSTSLIFVLRLFFFLFSQPLYCWVALSLFLNSVWQIPRRRHSTTSHSLEGFLRIGIVTEYYYPHQGGITEAVEHSAEELTLRGHKVTIITSQIKNRREPALLAKSFDIVTVGISAPILGNGSKARITMGSVGSRLQLLFSTQAFDVIYIHSPLTPLLPMLTLRYAPCPVIGIFHTVFSRRPVGYWIFKNMLKTWLQSLSGIIAVSAVCADQLNSFFQQKAEIIPNGIPARFWRHHERLPHKRVESTGLRILFIGRMEVRNGIATLIEAFKLVHKAEPDTDLIIAGDGPAQFYFRSLVTSDIREHVFFVGEISSGKQQLFKSADINVCPMTVAAMSVTLLECMISGNATIVSDISAFREVVTKNEVCFASAEEPRSFAREILRCIRDAELRATLGANARKKALEKYDWPVVVSRLLDYTKQILEDCHTLS